MDSSVTNSAAGRPEKAPTVVISIDAMGGDRGPAAVVAGIAESAEKNPDIHFIVHGPRAEIEQLIARRSGLAARCDIRDAAGVVTMDDKPSQVLRKGEGTSMWSAVESVRLGEATVAVSCGNTGALMALSMLRLRKLPGGTKLYTAPPLSLNLIHLLEAGNPLSNTAYSLALKPGHSLTTYDCELLAQLRANWDAAVAVCTQTESSLEN